MGIQEISFSIAEIGTMTDAAVAFQVNSWGDANTDLKMYFDLLCTKIELIDYVGPPAPPPPVTAETFNLEFLQANVVTTTIINSNPVASGTVTGTSLEFVFPATSATIAAIKLTDAQRDKINAVKEATGAKTGTIGQKVTVTFKARLRKKAGFFL